MSDQDKGQKDVLAAIQQLSEAVSALNTKVTALETSDVTVAGLKRAVAQLAEKVDAAVASAAPAVEERERERTSLVQELAGHYRVPFTAAQLEAKPLDELRMIKQMATSENFSGRGGPQGKEHQPVYAEPVKYWETGKKEGN